MDELFSNLAIQTVQLVGKAAFGAAGTIAMKRVSEYVHRVPHSAERQPEVERLRGQFESKLRIITPAIDLIDIISARGHSTMASVLQLTNSLRSDIVAFSAKLERMDRLLDELDSDDETPQQQQLSQPPPPQQQKSDNSLVSLFRRRTSNAPEIRGSQVAALNDSIVSDLKTLLAKIEDAVPLLNLALTTSGAHLGSSLPSDVSPSRLMQASALLTRASAWFSLREDATEALVGEPLTLRLYSLFVGSVRPKSKHDFTWKEEFARCHIGLWRVAVQGSPDSMYADYCYELRLVEDQNDGRYHDEAQDSGTADAAPQWVTRMSERLPCPVRPGQTVKIQLGDIVGLHYTSAGSLLNIEDSNSPVLVISFEAGRSADVIGATASDVPHPTKWYALEVAGEDVDEPNDSDIEDNDGEASDAGANNEQGSPSISGSKTTRSGSSCSTSASSHVTSAGSGSSSSDGEGPGSDSSDSEGSGSDSSEYVDSESDDSEGSSYEDATPEAAVTAPKGQKPTESAASEDSDSESSASESHGSDASESSKPEAEATKSSMARDKDIDELAHSVASLCTIAHEDATPPPPPRADQTPLRVPQSPARPVSPAGSFSSSEELAASEEYFRPIEFLANEWRLCTLSLLEYMVRLASIEISEQASHLEVPDEKLRLYLMNGPSESTLSGQHSVPGGQPAYSTPFRASTGGSSAAMLDMATPVGRGVPSPMRVNVATVPRTPSTLGSPALSRARRGFRPQPAAFETPRRRHKGGL